MPYMTPIRTLDPSVKRLALSAFPSYRGRKFSLSTNIPSTLSSYWDGGSKDYYAFVEISSARFISDVPSNHPFYEKDRPRDLPLLPPGVALIQHSIFCGKDCGLAVYVNPCDLAPLLPQSTSKEVL